MRLQAQVLSAVGAAALLAAGGAALGSQAALLGPAWLVVPAGLLLVGAAGVAWGLAAGLYRRLGGEPEHLIADLHGLSRGRFQAGGPSRSGVAAAIADVSDTLRDVARQANRIALGDYTVDIAPRSDADELGAALQGMTRTLREVARIAERLGDGDLDLQAEVKGEQDVLARAINRMLATLKDLTAQANRIAAGDYSADIAPRSGQDGLGAAMQAMTAALRAAHREGLERDWLKVGVARLSQAVQGDPTLDELAGRGLAELAGYLEAQVGALYLLRDGPRPVLGLRGSYAYSRRKNLSNEFALGEGLVGQAALERQQILVRHCPEDYVRIVSGLGEAVPRFLCVTPILYESRLKGVVEIGVLGDLTALQMDYLGQAARVLAIAIESAEARERQARLLEQAQRLNEELQAQQEELRANNEALETQSQRLRESEERLKAQQEELEVSNEELEEKNQMLERQKREVEQAKRILALKADELATASRYKSEFLANMSHELRTPLNSLLLLAQSLAENKAGNLSSDQVEAAHIIHGSGKDLLNLINEILDLSKIEAGRMELQIGPVRIRDLADGLRASFAHLAAQKGLELQIEVAEDAPAETRGDARRLEQVLRNLVANAIKFTEQGRVQVHFGRPAPGTTLGRSGLAPDACLAIAVTDTGIGIPKDKHEVIFEAFQQADGGTSRRYGGTGLGLTISRELTALLGGEIQLQSAPGAGSVFTLYLPVAAPAPPLPAPVPAAGGPARHPEAMPQEELIADDRDTLAEGEKFILVIEDDPKFAAILLDKCHAKGIKCLVVPTGEAGLKLIGGRLPVGIILDVRLPGMDGMAVLAALKEDVRTRHVPVHVVSVDERVNESLRRGAVGHAVKPLDQERLEGVFLTLHEVAARKPRRVLLVEDDAVTRRETAALIADDGVQVDEAASGEQAIQMLHAGHYDCIVLDLKLPDMDGQAMIERLEREGAALPPVVVHTARDLSPREEMDLRAHAESIVIKDARSPERLLDEVTLFLHQVVSQMPERKRRILRELHDGDAVFRGKRVLIVDDDMRTMFAVSHLVSERGFDILKAENGERALEVLAQHPDVDLVLMDVMMPVLDGYETMRRIRAQERFRRLPIIALTAKAMPEDRQKCIAAGASDYLTKPVDGERLFSLLRVWLYG